MNNKKISFEVSEFLASLFFDFEEQCHWFKFYSKSKNTFDYQTVYGIIKVEYFLDLNLNLKITIPQLKSFDSNVLKIFFQKDYQRLEKPIYEFDLDTDRKQYSVQLKIDPKNAYIFVGIFIGKYESMPHFLIEYRK